MSASETASKLFSGDNQSTIIVVSALAATSVLGMGSAYLYFQSQVKATQRALELKEEEHKAELRRQRRKAREQYRNTIEYQRKKQLKEEQQQAREAEMQEVAYFNENDEMVMTKIDNNQADNLPAGYVKVNKGQALGTYKVEKNTSSEAFMEQLDKLNQQRVENNAKMSNTNAART